MVVRWEGFGEDGLGLAFKGFSHNTLITDLQMLSTSDEMILK